MLGKIQKFAYPLVFEPPLAAYEICNLHPPTPSEPGRPDVTPPGSRGGVLRLVRLRLGRLASKKPPGDAKSS